MPDVPDIVDGGDWNLIDGGVLESGDEIDGGVLPTNLSLVTGTGAAALEFNGRIITSVENDFGTNVNYERQLNDLRITASFSDAVVSRIGIDGNLVHRTVSAGKDLEYLYQLPDNNDCTFFCVVIVTIEPGGISFIQGVQPPNALPVSLTYEIDSLIGNISNSITQKLAGKNPATDKVRWEPFNHLTSTYVHNPSLWAADYDFSGVSVWNSGSATGNSSVVDKNVVSLITPRCILMARHFLMSNNSTIRFVTQNGELVTRTQLSRVLNPDTDIAIGLLDAPVTNCTPLHLPPAGWEVNFPNNGKWCLVAHIDQQQRVNVLSIRLLNHSEIVPVYVSLVPVNTLPLSFYEEPAGGDSGSPLMMLGFEHPILIGGWTSPTSGSAVSRHRAWIDQTCQSLAGETPITSTLTFSG